MSAGRDAPVNAARRGLDRGIAAALVVYAGWELRGFLGPGLPTFFDYASHVARTWFVAQAFEAGTFPGWTHWWYGGYRLLEFYSPLYYWLSGALTWVLGGDPILATKWTLWAGLVALVLATHLFLRRLVTSPWLAAAGAVWLLKGPLVRWIFGSVGNLPSLVPLLALPFWLARLERRSPGAERPAALFAATALAVAAMLAGHLTNALLLLPAALAFAALSAWQRRGAAAGLAGSAVALGLGGLAGGALTGFVWLPAWLDLDLASLALVGEAPAGVRLDPHPVMVAAGRWGFSWEYSKVRDHGYWVFHGALLLALLSLLPGLRRSRPAALALAATLAASPLAEGRALLALPFYLSALWVQALDGLGARLGRTLRPRAAAGLGILPLIAVVWWPGLERDHPVPRYEPAGALDVYRRLPRGTGRTFDLSFGHDRLDAFYGASALSPWFSGRAIPFGGFPQGAPLDTNVSMALASPWTGARLAGPGAWPEALLDVLALLHVEYLVEREGGDVFHLEGATPALFAPRLEPLPAPLRGAEGARANPLIGHLVRSWRESRADLGQFLRHAAFSPVIFTRSGRDWGLLALVEQMGIDRRRATALRFFAARTGDASEPGSAPHAGAEFAVLAHVEGLERIEVRARSSAPGFVRLAYSWDPELRVRLDGEPAEPIPDALGGGFVLRFPEGEHTIAIRPPRFALRKALAAAALPLAALLLALWAASRAQPAGAGSRGSADTRARVPAA